MKKSHQIAYKVLRFLGAPLVKLWLGYDCEKVKELPGSYIIMSNHNTDLDPVLVALSFSRPMAFVASEHVARSGIWYKILASLAMLVLRKKGTTASTTVKEILKTVRGGTNVCIFAEGDKSWDGVTREILPATGKMVKTSRCGLITYRLEGGYFVSPRWSKLKNMRRGHFYGKMVQVYTPEDLSKMSVEEINAIIAKDLYEDAYTRQLEAPKEYKGKDLADGLEKVLFLCEKCGQVDSFQPDGSRITCTHCGHEITYTTYGFLEGSSHETIHSYVEWEKKQLASSIIPKQQLVSTIGRLITVEGHEEHAVADGKVRLSKSGLYVDDWFVDLHDIQEMSMFGNKSMVFTANKEYYELTILDQSSALKFQMFWDGCKDELTA